MISQTARHSAILVAAALCIGAASSAFASSFYYTTLPVPGTSFENAWDINNSGQVVGFFTSSGTTQGYLLSGSTLTPLDVASSTYTFALGINNSGKVVGEYGTS